VVASGENAGTATATVEPENNLVPPGSLRELAV
jgi:hypothetical protein